MEGARVKEEKESNNTLRCYRPSNDVYLVTFIWYITVAFSLEESLFVLVLSCQFSINMYNVVVMVEKKKSGISSGYYLIFHLIGSDSG